MSSNTNLNANRKSITTSLIAPESTTGRILDSEANVILRGESASSQGIEDAPVTEKTFEDTKNIHKQNGLFVSLNDWFVYNVDPFISKIKTSDNSEAPIDGRNRDYNVIKSEESDVGNLYSSLLDIRSRGKSVHNIVNTDHKPSKQIIVESKLEKKTHIFNHNIGYSVGNLEKQKVMEVERENFGEQNDEAPIERKDDTKKSTRQPFVIIEEDRKDNPSLQEHGEYSEETHIRIEVLRTVSPFTFGTRQEFDPVEPRGSQTPMRFYNKNPGRSLGFSADFHQQEYPLEPLLSIAEKAQYLCRPYRHGDYALIPKLVRVTIPGRVFRGYLQSADITYQGDDYRSWSLDQFKPTEAKVHNSLPYYEKSNKDNPFYEYPIEENQTDRIRNDVSPLGNDNEAIDYGLSEINIRFDLLITEEIKLTSFMTDSEKQSLKEAEEMAKRRKELEDALEKARDFLKNHSEYDQYYMPEDLILVDKDSGDFVGFRFVEYTDQILLYIPEGEETYKNYKNASQLKLSTSNQSSGISNILMSLPQDVENPVSSNDMLTYLIRQEMEKFPAKDPIEIERELTEKYAYDKDALFNDYKDSILKSSNLNNKDTSLGYAQSVFLSSNFVVSLNNENQVKDVYIKIPQKLKNILDIPLSSNALLSDIDLSEKSIQSFIAGFPIDIEINPQGFYDIDSSGDATNQKSWYWHSVFNYGTIIKKKYHLFDSIFRQFYSKNLYYYAVGTSNTDTNKEYTMENCGFSFKLLRDLKILNSSQLTYIETIAKDIYNKDSIDDTLLISFNVLSKYSRLLDPPTRKDRTFLDHVIKTLIYIQEISYTVIDESFLNFRDSINTEVVRNIKKDTSDNYYTNIVKSRGYKVFSDQNSCLNQIKSDKNTIEADHLPHKAGVSETVSFYYNYFYYNAI